MNISNWQTEIRTRLSSLLYDAKAELPDTAYGLISAVALAPVVSAFASGGDMMGAFGALNLVLAGVSGNLLATQLQKWVDMQKWADSDAAFTAQLTEDLKQQALHNTLMYRWQQHKGKRTPIARGLDSLLKDNRQLQPILESIAYVCCSQKASGYIKE